jgi:hypothetical protein
MCVYVSPTQPYCAAVVLKHATCWNTVAPNLKIILGWAGTTAVILMPTNRHRGPSVLRRFPQMLHSPSLSLNFLLIRQISKSISIPNGLLCCLFQFRFNLSTTHTSTLHRSSTIIITFWNRYLHHSSSWSFASASHQHS